MYEEIKFCMLIHLKIQEFVLPLLPRSLSKRFMKYSHQKIHLYLIVLLMVGCNTLFAQSGNDTTLYEVLTRAYGLLKIGSPDAQQMFERAAAMDPGNAVVHKQLGYLYHANGDKEHALQQLLIADSLQSSDTTKLEIAYWLDELHRRKEADEYFKRLSSSQSPEVRQQVSDEMANRPAPASPWYTRIYAAPYYDTRWETWFYQGFLQQGYYWNEARTLSAYGFAALSGDARSNGGLAPSIFSDNTFMVGVGLKAEPFTGFQASVQEGISFDLIQQQNQSSVRGDFRAVAVYGNGIYAPYVNHPDLQFPFYTFVDLYSSLGYYSRYDNTIGYVTGRAGVRPVEVSRTVVDAYIIGGLVRDTKLEYYNNLLEWGAGVRITPNINWGLYLMAEYHRGYYWDVGGPPLPYDRYYNSVRFFIIFDKVF